MITDNRMKCSCFSIYFSFNHLGSIPKRAKILKNNNNKNNNSNLLFLTFIFSSGWMVLSM